MKKILLLSVAVFSAFFAFAQQQQFLVLKGQDTIFCKEITTGSVGGEISVINYEDVSGADHKIEGKTECAKLVSFTEGEDIYDMLPIDLEKNLKFRPFQRVTSGKIGMWFYSTKEIGVAGKNQVSYKGLNAGSQGSSGANHVYFTLDGGPITRLDIGIYKKQIYPILSACSSLMDEFRKAFGVFESQTCAMCKYYNENCGQ